MGMNAISLGLNASTLCGGDQSPVPQIVLSSGTIAESAATGTLIGTLSVSNGSGTYAFSITADPDSKFQLDAGDDTQLEVGAALDYETATSHLVTIEADNGVDDPITRQFTIGVTNVAEASFVYAMTGALTDDGATIAVACDAGTNVRIAYSTDSGVASPAYSSVGATEANSDVAKIALSGLSADTVYYYKCEVDGALDSTIYSFKTQLVGAQHGFSFAMSGDATISEVPNVYSRIAARAPDFFLALGDTPYSDVATDDQDAYRTDWQTYYGNSNTQQLLATVPYVHIWDDHDFATDNANAASAGAPAAKAVYRQLNPHYPLEDSGAIYHSFVIGRVKFIMLDTRSERVPASNQLISPTQMAWLKAELDTVGTGTIRAAVISVGVPWIASSSSDTWFGASAQRTEIADYIINNSLAGRVVMVAADMHAIAADDGTNNVFGTGGLGGWPVWHAAPLNRGSSTKGGPYISGPYASSNGQYGTIDVVDDGSEVTLTFKGYDGTDTLLVTQVFTSDDSPYDVPDAFAGGQWSVADEETDGEARVTVGELPSSNGPAISDIEFDVDGDDDWTSLGLSAPGSFVASELTNDTEQDIRLRAVNAIGPSLPSAAKPVTPTVGAGTPFGTLIQAKTNSGTDGSTKSSLTITPDATPTSGNLILLIGGPDKTVSDFVVPSGFTLEFGVTGVSGISGIMAWKISDGTESGPLEVSWTGAEKPSLAFLEVQGPFDVSPIDVSDAVVDGANTNTLSLDAGTTSVADVFLVAFYLMDTMRGIGLNGAPTVNNGYTIVAQVTHAEEGTWEWGHAGMLVATKLLTATGGTAITITADPTATDQRIGGLYGFKKGS